MTEFGAEPEGADPRTTSRFDPRFDPAFQPGYDATNDPAAAARSVRSSESTASSPGAVMPPMRTPDAQHPEVTDGIRPDQVGAVSSAADGRRDVPPAPTGRNPFVIALAILSAVFVISGIGIVRWVSTLNQQGSTTAGYDYLLALVAVFGAAMLIVLGFATATGMLFLSAVRWGRNSASAE